MFVSRCAQLFQHGSLVTGAEPINSLAVVAGRWDLVSAGESFVYPQLLVIERERQRP